MNGSIDPPKFSSKDEEIEYWKKLAHEYMEEADRVQKDADEFMVESKQLEKEYEATIDQNEKKIKDMSLNYNRAQNEIGALRVKLDIFCKETTNHQTEIEALKRERQQLLKKIRDLEQINDDLERSRRIIEESISGFEQALNSALEKNAILESEEENLKEKLQRLADEGRDLKQEVLAKEKERVPDNERFLNGYKNPALDANRLKENETQTSPAKRDYQTPLSPASRVMALNIVSDLIRKVGWTRFLCSQCGQVKCTVCDTSKLNGSLDKPVLNSSS